jgi:DNA-binding NarL/FixJ family response regulator
VNLSGTLTPRQIEIVQLMVDGRNCNEIAIEMGISAFTVKCHISNIHERLDVHSKVELVITAIKLGLVDINNRFS